MNSTTYLGTKAVLKTLLGTLLSTFQSRITLQSTCYLVLAVSFLCAGCHVRETPWSRANSSASWATVGGSPHGNYYSSSTIGNSLVIRWQRHNPVVITTSPAISDYEQVSFTGHPVSGCSFYTLDMNSGRSVFCRFLGNKNSFNNPLADHYGNIYTGGYHTMLAFDWFGPLRWRQKISGTIVAMNFISPGIIVAITDTGHIIFVDSHRGDLLGSLEIFPTVLGLQNTHFLKPRAKATENRFLAPILIDQVHAKFFITASHDIWAFSTQIFPQQKPQFNPETAVYHSYQLRQSDICLSSRLLWHKHFSDSIQQLSLSEDAQILYGLGTRKLMFIAANTGAPFTSDYRFPPDIPLAKAMAVNSAGDLDVLTARSLLFYRKNSHSHLVTSGISWQLPHIIPCSRPVQLSNHKLLLVIGNIMLDQKKSTDLIEIDGNSGTVITSVLLDSMLCQPLNNNIVVSVKGNIIVSLSNGLVTEITSNN